MQDLNWNDVAECFEVDGSLLDAYVFDASMTDWQHVIDVVRAQAWWFDYTVEGSSLPLPEDVGEIFEHRGDAAITLHVRPTPTVLVNTHFFSDDEIEFDFDPRSCKARASSTSCARPMRSVPQSSRIERQPQREGNCDHETDDRHERLPRWSDAGTSTD